MNEELPLVSIVMPSYNQAPFLEQAILSVLDQDYGNVELIVIDGGSNDESVEIIRRYSHRIGCWISEPDSGPVEAINKGLAKCNGEFLGVMFSDDTLCLDAISRKIALFNAEPELDFIYGDVEQIDVTGTRLFVRYGNSLPYHEWIRTCTMPIAFHSSLWRRSVMASVGGLRVSMGVATDWDFFLRVCLKCRISYLPGIAGQFRTQLESQSSTKQVDWVTLVPLMYEEYFARNDLPGEILRIKKEALASAHVYSGLLLVEYVSRTAAIRELIRSLRLYPPILFSRQWRKLAVLWVMGPSGKSLWDSLKKTIIRIRENKLIGFQRKIKRCVRG